MILVREENSRRSLLRAQTKYESTGTLKPCTVDHIWFEIETKHLSGKIHLTIDFPAVRSLV